MRRKKWREFSDEELQQIHLKNQARYFERKKLCDCSKRRKNRLQCPLGTVSVQICG